MLKMSASSVNLVCRESTGLDFVIPSFQRRRYSGVAVSPSQGEGARRVPHNVPRVLSWVGPEGLCLLMMVVCRIVDCARRNHVRTCTLSTPRRGRVMRESEFEAAESVGLTCRVLLDGASTAEIPGVVAERALAESAEQPLSGNSRPFSGLANRRPKRCSSRRTAIPSSCRHTAFVLQSRPDELPHRISVPSSVSLC